LETPDEQMGYDIITSALQQPFYKILDNAGFSKEEVVTLKEKILASDDKWYGYNPREQNFVNMYEQGIIDPTKVTRLALENAASVAGTLLITEAVISQGKQKKENKEGGMDPNMLLG
jgi:chaperonin GroEL